MNKRKRGKILYTIQTISTIPLLILGVLILIVGTHFFTKSMQKEIALELKYVAENTIAMLDLAYPGDYELVGDSSYRLFKGETDITSDYALIDRIKKSTNMDVTLFYQDTRIQSTILNKNGSRFIGNAASDVIMQDVFYGDNPHFYNNAMVNGITYFSYYVPLHNSDGSVVGMLFVGKPRTEVDQSIQQTLYPLIFAVLVTMGVIVLWISYYTRGLVNVLVKIRNFTAEVSAGNLDATLPKGTTSRNDELGDISESILTMQRSLRNMVEQDALTGLYNRRSADRKMRQVAEKASGSQTPFTIVIGDIDFFKKINDTYGHDCGDVVLKQVARLLKEQMRKNGFVARWGGEEFLLVFDHANTGETTQILEDILNRIRSLEIPYEEHTIRLTMTFGLAENDGSGLNELLRRADHKLYEGKSEGRNRIIQ